jgi:hypothetical protein
MLGNRREECGRIGPVILLIGKYSLFGYVAQIAILKVVQRGLQHIDLGSSALGVSFFAGLALTLLSVAVVHRARARAPVVNKLYSAIFS